MQIRTGQIRPFGDKRPGSLKVRAGLGIVITSDNKLPNAG
jgi:hypothetical protein